MRLLVLALAATGLACGSAVTDPHRNQAPAIPPATMVALDISPDSVELALGETHSFTATKVMSDGSRVPVTPRWSITQPGIAVVDFYGRVTAVGAGNVDIRATFGEREARAKVTVLRPALPGESDVLDVESFSVLEFDYPSRPGHWYYAPQVSVRAAPGEVVTILTMDFSIPGLPGPIPPKGCGATITSSQSFQLNGEVYGDWAFAISSPERRATGDTATMVLSYTNRIGVLATRTIKGPIIGGSLPGTYGVEFGACYTGYRDPG